jgi:hypothetical protein
VYGHNNNSYSEMTITLGFREQTFEIRQHDYFVVLILQTSNPPIPL